MTTNREQKSSMRQDDVSSAPAVKTKLESNNEAKKAPFVFKLAAYIQSPDGQPHLSFIELCSRDFQLPSSPITNQDSTDIVLQDEELLVKSKYKEWLTECFQDRQQKRLILESINAATGDNNPSTADEDHPGYKKCDNLEKCKACRDNKIEDEARFVPEEYLPEAYTKKYGNKLRIPGPTSCTTTQAVYLFICCQCKEMYVGETKGPVKKRWQAHWPVEDDIILPDADEEGNQLINQQQGTRPRRQQCEWYDGTRVPKSCTSAVRLHFAEEKHTQGWIAVPIQTFLPGTKKSQRTEAEEEWRRELGVSRLNDEQTKMYEDSKKKRTNELVRKRGRPKKQQQPK